MPKLSLYRPNKQNDYRFFDRTISEELRVGGTDLYIHKYLGPTDQGPSIDYTQPQYETMSPVNIQDLLFLENRDRTYDPNIYRLRGHYNVQNLDFDLSQFGLFLNNDIVFITVHYNDMIDIVGRKLMVGDVLELPHLLDYNPLKETIPVALKRFMQITDANYASEGFSQTWFPHLWRIKCEPLVDSEEFSQILQEPINQDNYLGVWDITKPYPEGYIISYGDKNYISIADVPAGTNPPNTTYWRLTEEQNLKDILGTYNRNIAINNANLEEAKRLLPKSGYDNSNLYIVPTYGEYSSDGVLSGKYDQPAPPTNVVTSAASTGAPNPVVEIFTSTEYVNDSPYLRIPAATIAFIKDNILDVAFPGIPSAPVPTNVINTSGPTPVPTNPIMFLSAMSFAAPMTDGGSGSVQAEMVLTIDSMMTITGPYGTADNTYSTADQNPEAPGFTDEITPVMDFRADCDPRFQFIARSSPRSFGYTTSYLSGDGQAPNGFPTGAGISFPQNPQVGDYFLRIDYLPQLLYRWDGQLWVRISENVRTDTGLIDDDKTQTASFINNSNVTVTTSGTVIPQKQALSTMLTIAPDPLPPVA
jgi:hypothetical protein